jgi:hypothetical protein
VHVQLSDVERLDFPAPALTKAQAVALLCRRAGAGVAITRPMLAALVWKPTVVVDPDAPLD